MSQDVDSTKENLLRGENKLGGKRVFYTQAALDEFISKENFNTVGHYN